jgi:hypothetical protein
MMALEQQAREGPGLCSLCVGMSGSGCAHTWRYARAQGRVEHHSLSCHCGSARSGALQLSRLHGAPAKLCASLLLSCAV